MYDDPVLCNTWMYDIILSYQVLLYYLDLSCIAYVHIEPFISLFSISLQNLFESRRKEDNML
jgi:hypothetical protein